MWKQNVPEKIHALPVGAKNRLILVQLEFKILLHEFIHLVNVAFERAPILADANEVVTKSDIPADTEFVFNELIELVQIHIGKQLARYVSKRDALSGCRMETSDNLLKNREHTRIINDASEQV